MEPREIRVSGGNIIGWFSSVKNNGLARYHSTLERDVMYPLEFDNFVSRYKMHPFVYSSTAHMGELHSYTPDCQAFRAPKNLIIECKPEQDLEKEDSIRQFCLGNAWGLENDHLFLIVTDTQLRSGHRLENLKKFYRYSRKSVDYAIIMMVSEFLNIHTQGVSVSELINLLNKKHTNNTPFPDIISLLFSHFLITDLDIPFTHDSPIWLESQKPDYPDSNSIINLGREYGKI